MPETLDFNKSASELCRDVCNVPSVSGDETLLADLVYQELQKYPHLHLTRDGDTIVAQTKLGRERRVIIAGHLDTVPINDNLPIEDRVIDGEDYLWGRGTVDMKSGTAVQLALAAELADPKVDITWMWYDHEEVEAEKNGLGRLSRNHPELFQGDFAILGEPTDGQVEAGCNGTLRAVITSRGVRSHSARSWIGKNAIHGASEILQRLAQYQAQTLNVDGLEYREGMNAVKISGGVAGNVIPDLCEVEVNYRFAPSRSLEQAQEEVRELFDGFEIRFTDGASGARPGLNNPFVAGFVAEVGAELAPKYGWTDVARFSALGVPALNYGPGDPLLAHHDEERVKVAQIESVYQGLKRWLSQD